jgi:hypothetical protein
MPPGAASRHLDALARALADAGWTPRPRYDRIPAVLQVFAADVPLIGESVHVRMAIGGAPWFFSSTDELCASLPTARPP